MGDGASGHEVEYHAHDASEQGTHAGTDEIETDVDDEGDQTDDEGQAQVGRRVPCRCSRCVREWNQRKIAPAGAPETVSIRFSSDVLKCERL